MVIPVKLMSWSLAGSSPAVRIFFFAWKWTKWGLLTCVPPSIVPIYIDLHADFQQIFITATGKVGEWLIRSPTKRLPKGSWVRTSFLSFCEHLFFFVWYIWNLSNLTPFSPKKKVHSLPKVQLVNTSGDNTNKMKGISLPGFDPGNFWLWAKWDTASPQRWWLIDQSVEI